ncbi:hypothetical protein H2199_004164 [Coniosporium tulheliwenetii]|uniref:Uncharacterized protein n=1 Tax=Coniosporium tulheliwenetii TaxID=3383036 RepID=A0ACC2Z756_9PEZI|nr:hypothetical protein H2199_004164 [Cladosporium sp. JES 115]
MEGQLRNQLGDELYRACKEGRLKDITSLVERRRAADPTYNPPLYAMMTAAASTDRANVVGYCLREGGSVTDAVMAALVGNHSFGTHKLLVTSKAVDVDRVVPWHGDILGIVAPAGDNEWAKFCLQNGANPNLNMVDEFKPGLAATAERGITDMVSLLLEHGAWLKGSGAIVLAAEAGKKDMVRFLLEHGADIDEIGVEDPTDDRETEEMGSALHKAVSAGHKGIVELLIDKGANIKLKDAKGRTPLGLAEESRNAEIVELLQSRGAG